MAIFRVLTLALMLLVATSVQSSEQESIPAIIDTANLLTSAQASELDSLISSHNQSGLGHIRLLVVPKLPPNTTIENYSNAILQKDIATPGASQYRALFVIAMDNRKFIIEAAPAIRNTLSNEFIQRIIDNTITPRFRKGQFFSGIRGGITEIIEKLDSGKRVMKNALAEITKLQCADTVCIASIKSNEKLIVLMWTSQIRAPEGELLGAWVYTQDYELIYGHEYNLIRATESMLEISVIASSEPRKIENTRKNDTQKIITTIKDKNGIYSFTPFELIGIGKIVMKESPEEPGKLLVGGPTLAL